MGIHPGTREMRLQALTIGWWEMIWILIPVSLFPVVDVGTMPTHGQGLGLKRPELIYQSLPLIRAGERYEAIPGLAFFPGNFLEDEPQEPYDLIFEHTLYCAIDPARRDEYAKAVTRWLKPGGHFLAIHFTFPLTEEGPPFGASREEIIDRFSDRFELIEEWEPRNFEGREREERMFYWKRK